MNKIVQALSCGYYIIATILAARWRRKKEGLIGLFGYSFEILHYFILIILAGLMAGPGRTYTILLAYAWLRRLDDVIDNDAQPPRGFNTAKEYLVHKIEVAILYSNEASPYYQSYLNEDKLLLAFIRRTKRYGIDIGRELIDEVMYLGWDFNKRTQSQLPERREFSEQAYSQDRSLFIMSIKILQGNLELFEKISGSICGIFTRIDWLADIEEDIEKGIINIPREFKPESVTLQSALYAWKKHEHAQVMIEWANARGKILEHFHIIFPLPFFSLLIKFVVRKFEDMILSINKKDFSKSLTAEST